MFQVIIIMYIDDILILGLSFEDCQAKTRFLSIIWAYKVDSSIHVRHIPQIQMFQLSPVEFLIPLEVKGDTVPHLKALSSEPI